MDDKNRMPVRLLIALAVLGATVAAFVLWEEARFVVAGVAALLLLPALLAGGANGAPGHDRFPDERSDTNRRIWADDHNWEAGSDADLEHDAGADGDLPW